MIMNRQKLFLLLIVLLVAAANVDAARNILRLGFEHGLSNNYVMGIAQDRNGFVWISTESGLNRYVRFFFPCF